MAIDLRNNSFPTDWKLIPIKDMVSKYRAGGTPRRSVDEYWDNGTIPFTAIEDLTKGNLYLSVTAQHITSLGLANSNAWLVPSGAVLVSMYATIGATAINTVPVTTNQAILCLVLKKGFSKEYVAYALRYARDRLEIQNIESTQKNVNKAIVGNFVLPVPPMVEQQKIATLLLVTQRAIKQQERLIELTTELKKALMHKLFTEGTRGELQKETEIGPMPASWSVTRLGDLIEFAQYGLSIKGGEQGNYPMLRMTNQVDGRIVPNDLRWVEISREDFKKFSVKKGDLLFNRTNSFELVGRTAIFDIDGDYVFASYLIRLCVVLEKLDPFFLNYYLNSDTTQQRLKSIATRAVSQSNISATRLKGFLIPLPSLEEQRDFVYKFKLLDQKISKHRQWVFLLQSLFRTLLHQLMTAQIRVNDLDLSELEFEPLAAEMEEPLETEEAI